MIIRHDRKLAEKYSDKSVKCFGPTREEMQETAMELSALLHKQHRRSERWRRFAAHAVREAKIAKTDVKVQSDFISYLQDIINKQEQQISELKKAALAGLNPKVAS